MNDKDEIKLIPSFMDKVLEKIEAITTSTKPAPVDNWDATAELVFFHGPRRPDVPTYSKRNLRGDDVAMRQLDIIFDTPSATTYAFVYVNGIQIFGTTNDGAGPHSNSRQSPYHGTDISLDFRQGIRIPHGTSVDVYLYDTDIATTGEGGHAANILVSFGGI